MLLYPQYLDIFFTFFRRSLRWVFLLLAVPVATAVWRDWQAQRGPRLMGLLNHPDLRVRAAAARKLGELRDERAVSALIERVNNDCVEVAGAAMEALGAIGGPEAMAELMEEAKGPKGLSGNAQRALLGLGLDRQGPP